MGCVKQMSENLSLKFKKLWIGVGWGLVLGVIVSSLIPPPSFTQIQGHGDKVAHILAYFVLMGWFAQIYHSNQQRLLYMLGFLLLGVGLEILQGLSGIRHADWLDILANSAGVFLAWYLTKNRFASLLGFIENKCLNI